MPSIMLNNFDIFYETKSEMLRVEPWAAGLAAQTPSLSYANPLNSVDLSP